MNWSKLQTYGESSEKAFEALCDQLFENWCKTEYKDSIKEFYVINGAGGDGGVESYAVLANGDIVGLQAKWFINSIGDSQIKQIKSSIATALKVRPAIKKYIVCVPRNLANETEKKKNVEQNRWDSLIAEFSGRYPYLTIELWNESRILSELQKDTSTGIHRYWFGNGDISYDCFLNAFEKSKATWLSNKYIQDLFTPGQINKTMLRFICDGPEKAQFIEKLKIIDKAHSSFTNASADLISLLKDNGDKTADIITELNAIQPKIDVLKEKAEAIIEWLQNENSHFNLNIELVCDIDFDSVIDLLKNASFSAKHYFHYREAMRPLEKLASINYYELQNILLEFLSPKPLIFKGNPGTGKTCGIAAFVEKLLSEKHHLPILIQAREIDDKKTWKDIVIDNLGLAPNWSEDELWQTLVSMSNRNSFSRSKVDENVKSISKVVIIVDGVDESAVPEKWEDRLKESVVINKKYPTIQFCATTRPHLFRDAEDYAQIKYLSPDGDTPTSVLFSQYINSYQIQIDNKNTIRYLLTTPLSLKLFCELYAGQHIGESTQVDFSLPELLSQKIDCIEKEFASKENVELKDQLIRKSIKVLTKIFLKEKSIERIQLIKHVANSIDTKEDTSSKVLEYLYKYGVLYCFARKANDLFSITEYFYSPGIRGFFDYAESVMMIESCSDPSEIDFTMYTDLEQNTLYGLALLCIRKYGYLITSNTTLRKKINGYFTNELSFFALRHTTIETGWSYYQRCLKYMSSSSDSLIDIVNKIVLPLSRVPNHPLGVRLLDEYLFSFEKPAQRDLVWAPIGYLNKRTNQIWDRNNVLELLDDEEYILNEDDTYNGCPTIYAWALSSLNNTLRMDYRNSLMSWALKKPEDFYELFLKFANVNDPQIQCDMYSILMCLLYKTEAKTILAKAYEWISANVLSPDKIDKNRNIAIRYYSLAIVYKAIELDVCNKENAGKLLPPYFAKTNQITLNKEALSGSRMGGFSGITYDLSRYVLIDHFEYSLGYGQKRNQKIHTIINDIIQSNPDYLGIDFEHFILSSAYAYVLEMGWAEETFYDYAKKDEHQNVVGCIDNAISGTYYPASHGSQSNVMTVCEKYIWQARYYLSGFLFDRLTYGDNNVPVKDYSILEDFIIPLQEMDHVNPDIIRDNGYWFVPEKEKVFSNIDCSCYKEVIENVKNASDLSPEEWLFCENMNKEFEVENKELIALYGFLCVDDGLRETIVSFNSLIVRLSELDSLIEYLKNVENIKYMSSPQDLCSYSESYCYITPKEICWFNWKEEYESDYVERIEAINANATTTKCCYHYRDCGDVEYYMPSKTVRRILGIKDTNGYLFYNNAGHIIMQYTPAGQHNKASRECLLADKESLLNGLRKEEKTIVWLFHEKRQEDPMAREKFGDFYFDKDVVKIGFFSNNKYQERTLHSEINGKED